MNPARSKPQTKSLKTTLGELVAALFDAAPSSQAVAKALSSPPLQRRLGRKIIVLP